MDAEELSRTLEAERDARPRGVRGRRGRPQDARRRPRCEVLGRKSPFAALQRALGGLDDEDDARRVGRRVNEVRRR